MDDQEFYQALKRYGVIVVPGSPFFPGLRNDWAHKHQCFRISLTDTAERIAIAIRRLAALTESVYSQA